MAAQAAVGALGGAVGVLGARFVLHWGEMGTRWGVSRTVAQIHALLYFLGRPMHAEEIALALQVARSNVSTSLRELQNWDLVKVTHLAGDRRDHFETELDPWALMRILVRERKEREFDPTLAFLRECADSPALSREEPATQKRLRDTLTLMESLSRWAEQMLGTDDTMLKRLVKLGAKLEAKMRA